MFIEQIFLRFAIIAMGELTLIILSIVLPRFRIYTIATLAKNGAVGVGCLLSGTAGGAIIAGITLGTSTVPLLIVGGIVGAEVVGAAAATKTAVTEGISPNGKATNFCIEATAEVLGTAASLAPTI